VNQTCGSLVAATLLTLFLSATLPAQTVIEQLYAQRKFEMADAYWLAGQKFTDLGQKERGDEFKAHALKLFPGYVAGVTPVFAPAQVPAANGKTSEASASVAGEPDAPEPTIPDANVVREQNLQGEKIVKLAWNKLLRGFLSGNAETVRSVLSDTLTLPPEGNSDPAPDAVSASDSLLGSELATAELAPSIEAFFTDHPLDLAGMPRPYRRAADPLS
jgi:hypothetical protein